MVEVRSSECYKKRKYDLLKDAKPLSDSYLFLRCVSDSALSAEWCSRPFRSYFLDKESQGFLLILLKMCKRRFVRGRLGTEKIRTVSDVAFGVKCIKNIIIFLLNVKYFEENSVH